VGFLGISQLGRFGTTRFVPELLVVAHFRELGPLVTAIVVAGRSGAGLASELGTTKVSEEIDALRTMGFDPMRWLVIPRCVALCIAVPVGGSIRLHDSGREPRLATHDLELRRAARRRAS
jgi:phospholipid/cholesterol/gamma-HCH transport system permease protein